MNQLKLPLGPYEFFAATIGGFPLLLSILVVFNPSVTISDSLLTLKNNLSFQWAVLMMFLSYLLGGIFQGVTYKIFEIICEWKDYKTNSLKFIISEKNEFLTGEDKQPWNVYPKFEDRLVLLLREKIGIPINSRHIGSRLTAYLRENGSQSTEKVEALMVNHIMYRNLSFGFLAFSVCLLISFVLSKSIVLDKTVLLLLLLLMSYLSFFRALAFKRLRSRELLLGFYFTSSKLASPWTYKI